MANFKIGDTVQLKSGGPIMTVNHIYNANGNSQKDRMLNMASLEDGQVCVIYFNQKNEITRDSFSPEVLTKIE